MSLAPQPPGEIASLGYVRVHGADLEGWERFGAGLLGLQPVHPAHRTLAFRMDAAAQRLTLSEDAGDAPLCFGWEVHGPTALDKLAARIEAAGRPVRRFTASEAEWRGVAAGVAIAGPCGNQLEFFHGLARADAPFAPGRPISGFRTGALGMGHAVLNVVRIDDVLPFYRDVLGFRLSDFTLRPFKAYFLHVNSRHHSLALIENARPGLHHLMMEVQGIDDMGQAYDLAQLEPGRVATSMGRHTNDHMVSFYVRSPSGFMIEYGWGGRDIDPQNWRAVEMHSGPSLWGHERDFLPEEMKAEARRLRLKAAADGERAPLRLARDV
jgi:2,3-dihydroxybiphenyl 1,2-dioxygenase